MSRKGNDLVRHYLWNAARSAIVHNPAIGALYRRLRAKGKRGDTALGQCMRKMLHLVYAVWKTNRPFEDNLYPTDTDNDAATPPAAANTTDDGQGNATHPEPTPAPVLTGDIVPTSDAGAAGQTGNHAARQPATKRPWATNGTCPPKKWSPRPLPPCAAAATACQAYAAGRPGRSPQGRFRLPASAGHDGTGPATTGAVAHPAWPGPATPWSLPDSRPAGRYAADFFGPSGQAPVPVLPRRLPRPGQRVGPVGCGTQTAALRGRPKLGGDLPAATQQRRGTRKMNPLIAAAAASRPWSNSRFVGSETPARKAAGSLRSQGYAFAARQRAKTGEHAQPGSKRGQVSASVATHPQTPNAAAVVTTDGKKRLDIHRYICFAAGHQRTIRTLPCSASLTIPTAQSPVIGQETKKLAKRASGT